MVFSAPSLMPLLAVWTLSSAALAQDCVTNTETYLAIATTLTEFDDFQASLDAVYSTPGVAFTGATVYVWTTVEEYQVEASVSGSFTAYGVYDANALTSAGFSITTETATITECFTEPPAEETETLSPSPTGQECSPHGDHWHCEEPTETGTDDEEEEASKTCAPHGDHWHCPDGVSEPTTPPSLETTATSSGFDMSTGQDVATANTADAPTSTPSEGAEDEPEGGSGGSFVAVSQRVLVAAAAIGLTVQLL